MRRNRARAKRVVDHEADLPVLDTPLIPMNTLLRNSIRDRPEAEVGRFDRSRICLLRLGFGPAWPWAKG